MEFANYDKLIDFIDTRRILDVDGDLLEIGTLLGGGARKLARYLKRRRANKKLFVIDIFDATADDSITPEATGNIRMSQIYQEILSYYGNRSQWDVFQSITAGCENIVALRGDSREVTLPADSLCFTFIDGNHHPEHITSDFQLAWSKTSPGGAVGFHDYGGLSETITEAIDDAISTADPKVAEVVILPADTIALCIKA